MKVNKPEDYTKKQLYELSKGLKPVEKDEIAGFVSKNNRETFIYEVDGEIVASSAMFNPSHNLYNLFPYTSDVSKVRPVMDYLVEKFRDKEKYIVAVPKHRQKFLDVIEDKVENAYFREHDKYHVINVFNEVPIGFEFRANGAKPKSLPTVETELQKVFNKYGCSDARINLTYMNGKLVLNTDMCGRSGWCFKEKELGPNELHQRRQMFDKIKEIMAEAVRTKKTYVEYNRMRNGSLLHKTLETGELRRPWER